MIASKRQMRPRAGADPAIALLKYERTGSRAAPLTASEVAVVLGCKRETVIQMCFLKKLKQLGGGRIMPDEVRRFLHGSVK
jgi:hypothetical protein